MLPFLEQSSDCEIKKQSFATVSFYKTNFAFKEKVFFFLCICFFAFKKKCKLLKQK